MLELAHGLKVHGIIVDIITTEVNKKNLERMGTGNTRIINLGNCIQIPILKQIHSSWLFHKADFSKTYDFFILSGNWAVFAARKHRPNIYYVHTPVRMFYDSKKDYYEIAPWYAKLPFLLWVKIHGYYVQKQFKYVNKIIANSKNVHDRIRRYHRRDSIIINPPIKKYSFMRYGDYWLAVTRLYPHKRIDLLFDVFRALPKEKLIIVGGYMKGDHSQKYMKSIIGNKPDNVEIIGEVDEKRLAKLYGECKAFITLSKYEDFGMTVLEANSAGKPVVATDEGGHKETVMNKRTGILVKAEKTDIIKAIKSVSKDPALYKNNCVDNAEKYSTKIFIKKISELILE